MLTEHSLRSQDRPQEKHMNETFEAGLKVRREVLGDVYVEHNTHDVSDFMAPLQELVTEYCWGNIWTRPGLSRRERSIINLGLLTALDRPNELRLHVRGAINNGLSQKEIGEVLLQTAIYCGVPAAIDSFKVAEEVFKTLEAEAS
jgi:4-carboxymuconolactone decarboxylase